MPNEKTCLHCGTILTMRANENKFRFATRKYCNQEHYRADYKKNKKGWYDWYTFSPEQRRDK